MNLAHVQREQAAEMAITALKVGTSLLIEMIALSCFAPSSAGQLDLSGDGIGGSGRDGILENGHTRMATCKGPCGGMTGAVWFWQEEAAAITGTSDPEAAAHAILDRPGAATQWCIVKLGSRGSVLCTKSPRATYRQHALMVGPQLQIPNMSSAEKEKDREKGPFVRCLPHPLRPHH